MKSVASSTIKSYQRNLLILDKLGIDYKNISDVNDIVDKIKNIQTKKKENIGDGYVRVYLASILWYFKINNIENENIQLISDVITQITQKDHQYYEENKLSIKEKNVFLHWNEIVDAYNKLYLDRSKNLTSFKNCVTIALYVLFPPRRVLDYSKMVVKKNTDNLNDTENYYISSLSLFVFNVFKTKDTCDKIFDVPNDLKLLLDEYIDKYDLYDKKLLNITENELSDKVKRIMKKVTNKSASVNTFRHSYISYMNDNGFIKTTKQKKDLAAKMGHSHHMQQDVYIKYQSESDLDSSF